MIDPNIKVLAEIELPAKGRQVEFRQGSSNYWIKAVQDGAWVVIGEHGAVLGHFARTGDLFVEIDEDAGPRQERNDWRPLVAGLT